MQVRECMLCGNDFKLSRKDKKFCNKKCNKAYARKYNGWNSQPKAKTIDAGVYIVKSRDLCKIGVSNNISNRLKKMACDNPFGIDLLHYQKIEDSYQTESLLHHKFSNKRTSGEWFNLSDSDIRSSIEILKSK